MSTNSKKIFALLPLLCTAISCGNVMTPANASKAPTNSYLVAGAYSPITGGKTLPATFPGDAVGTPISRDSDLGANCSNQIMITNDHDINSYLRDFLVCSSVSSAQAILVQAKHSYADGLCFFPLQVNNANDIRPIPNSLGDPASSCDTYINPASDARISFDSAGFNAVMIVEAGDRALARDCIDVKITSGAQPATPSCPAFVVIQFAQ